MKVLIVIPAYNEEENILNTVKGVVDAGYDYVVVNDGSSDNTLDICNSSGLNVLNLPNNLGIGGAVQAGHKYAFENGYDVDIQFDGDGQHDVSFIPALVRGISEGNDLVIGSRFIEGAKSTFQSSFMRRVGKTWISKLIYFRTGATVSDPTSGFRATGRELLKFYSTTYPADYPEPESIVAALKHGCNVKEVPVEMHIRQGGISSIGPISSIYYMMKVTLAILLI